MKLFQYALVWHPNELERKDGKKDKILVANETVLAQDSNGALMLAARAIPETYLPSLEQVEVVVRPF